MDSAVFKWSNLSYYWVQKHVCLFNILWFFSRGLWKLVMIGIFIKISQNFLCVTIMCHNHELSSMMCWVGSELLILFAEIDQILLKIFVIPILLTFIYMVALNLLVKNQLIVQLNSSLRHIIVIHDVFVLELLLWLLLAQKLFLPSLQIIHTSAQCKICR